MLSAIFECRKEAGARYSLTSNNSSSQCIHSLIVYPIYERTFFSTFIPFACLYRCVCRSQKPHFHFHIFFPFCISWFHSQHILMTSSIAFYIHTTYEYYNIRFFLLINFSFKKSRRSSKIIIKFSYY